MGLGLNYQSSGGEIIPALKYNAKSGKWSTLTRIDGETVEEDVTRSIERDGFVIDLENVETGTIYFAAAAAPEFNVTPLHDPKPPPPHDKHRPGVRFMVKLHPNAGGDVREVASVAKSFLQGVDLLHTAYEADALSPNNAGLVPLVRMADTTAITSTGKDKDGRPMKSTNYAPEFVIVRWVKRPADLVYSPRAPAAKPAQGERRTPPTTGSSRAEPPRKQAQDDAWDDQPPKQVARDSAPADDDWG